MTRAGKKTDGRGARAGEISCDCNYGLADTDDPICTRSCKDRGLWLARRVLESESTDCRDTRQPYYPAVLFSLDSASSPL